MAAALVAVAIGALALSSASSTSTGQRLLPSLSTTVLVGRENQQQQQQQQQQQRQPPLAVLRTSPLSSGERSPSSLEIFAEDPRWASKV